MQVGGVIVIVQWRQSVFRIGGTRSEARRAEARARRAEVGVWGSAVSSPSGVGGEAPAAVDFGALRATAVHVCRPLL